MPCLPDLELGDRFQFTTEPWPDEECDRFLRLDAPFATLTYFEADKSQRAQGGVGSSYIVSTDEGCSGLWQLDMALPPFPQAYGAPCDDCVFIGRYFQPSGSCDAIPDRCGNEFYARRTRID
jgi:hypothetical protein